MPSLALLTGVIVLEYEVLSQKDVLDFFKEKCLKTNNNSVKYFVNQACISFKLFQRIID